jgi:hypothetical protein
VTKSALKRNCWRTRTSANWRQSRSTIRRELGGLETQRDSPREQFVRISRGVLDEAVLTPCLTRSGIIAAGLRITGAGAGFRKPIS